MINAFSDDNGRVRRLPDASAPDVLATAIWIDLETPTPEEIQRVRTATKLEIASEAAVSEIETSSRLATRDDALYLSMSLISMADGPRGVSMGLVLTKQRLITIRFAPSRTFQNYKERLPERTPGPFSASYAFADLLDAIIDRQADALEQIRADLDEISHRIFGLGRKETGGLKNDDRVLRETLVHIGHIGDMISHIRDTEVSVARIVPYVDATARGWLPPELSPRLKSMQQDILSLSDFNTHLNDKLQFLLDATLGFINIAQNNVMKVMAIASVVGIPPVLVAGIYGMNFKNMPELSWEWGYAYGLALIAVTTLIPLLVFRLRNWI